MEKQFINKFSGIYFLGYRENSEYDKAGVVVLPLSYQGTTTYGKGTKDAPKAILNSSLYVEPFDEESKFSLEKKGIHTLKIQSFPDNTPAANVVMKTQNLISQILADKKFPVMIGGEHSISIGSILALSNQYSSFSVLQLDAHTDLDKDYEKNPFSHASMASKSIELTKGKVRFTQVGVRSIVPELIKKAKQTNTSIFYAHNIIGNKHKIRDIIHTLRKNVYITLDVDVFDPSIFPNTGTPEPNGLKWQYVINLIREVSKTRNIIGLDIVEHIPLKTEKRPHYSDFSAAKLLHKLLCIIFKNK